MAETSGFFDAELNEETQEYDLAYLSSQFAAYFALFVGNGVFGSPTNQLRVSISSGLNVKVSAGWAFINGYWYQNDEELILPVASNMSSLPRVDSVICRWSNGDRKISVLYQVGSTAIVRDGARYDLKLAEIIVPAGASSISSGNITDTRMNESVCGLVTGLLKSQTTEDLFAQYDAVFNEWFESIKEQVGTDMAVQLQQQIGTLSDLSTSAKSNLVGAINEVNSSVTGLKTGSVTVAKAVNATNAQTAQTAVTAQTAEVAETAGSANTATSASKLSTPVTINGVTFDGSKSITVQDSSKPNVVYSTTEPTTVPANTIIFVYEE